MKTGKTLEQLAAELTRQRDAKVDVIQSTDCMAMVPTSNGPRFLVKGGKGHPDLEFGIGKTGHEQIGEETGIPRAYYERCHGEDVNLLAHNVNKWLTANPQRKLVRALDDNVRALRSDKFRIDRDNYDFGNAALEQLVTANAEIVSCEITERKMYIKAIDQKGQREILKQTGNRLGDGSHRAFKDVVCPAVCLSNSEIGHGSREVRTSVYTDGCTNFAIIKERSVRSFHVGARHQMGEDAYAMLSDKTRRMTDEVELAQIREIVAGAFDLARFNAYCDKLQEAATVPLSGDPSKALEFVGKKYGFTETERGSILQYLVQGGDASKYGLHSAITRAAADLDSYDRATSFEQIGGEIIDLAAADWKEVLKAAA